MRFTVERLALLRVLRHVAGETMPGVSRKEYSCLTASGAWVFVANGELVAGTEALVLEEGDCVVHRASLRRLLQTYAPTRHLAFEADEKSLRFGSTALPVVRFSRTARVPPTFAVCKASTDWLASVSAGRAPDESLPRR